jgi:hypothetical protein
MRHGKFCSMLNKVTENQKARLEYWTFMFYYCFTGEPPYSEKSFIFHIYNRQHKARVFVPVASVTTMFTCRR